MWSGGCWGGVVIWMLSGCGQCCWCGYMRCRQCCSRTGWLCMIPSAIHRTINNTCWCCADMHVLQCRIDLRRAVCALSGPVRQPQLHLRVSHSDVPVASDYVLLRLSPMGSVWCRRGQRTLVCSAVMNFSVFIISCIWARLTVDET